MKWKKMNLQLFADAHEQLQNTTGSSGMSAEMKTFYERRLIDQALPALVHDQSATATPSRPTTARPLSSASMTRCPRPPRP